VSLVVAGPLLLEDHADNKRRRVIARELSITVTTQSSAEAVAKPKATLQILEARQENNFDK
jgi:hypothetical protein